MSDRLEEIKARYYSGDPTGDDIEWLIEQAERSDWVSVEDRLPVTGIKVLAYTPNTIGINSYKQPNIRLDETLEICGKVHFRGCDATHWMPVPEPPKGS